MVIRIIVNIKLIHVKIVKEIVEEDGYNSYGDIKENRSKLLEEYLNNLREVYKKIIKWYIEGEKWK